MAKYIHFTEEQKRQAAAVDLEFFLRSRGEKLIPSGREKRLASDHSITVRGNEWYDHAAEQGDQAVSFVQKFYGLSYPEAVSLSYLAMNRDAHTRQSREKNQKNESLFNSHLPIGICAASMPIWSNIEESTRSWYPLLQRQVCFMRMLITTTPSL